MSKIKMVILLLLIICTEHSFAQHRKNINEHKNNSTVVGQNCYKKRFITEGFYTVIEDGDVEKRLYHISATTPLLSVFSYSKHRVSEWSLLEETQKNETSSFSQCNVFVFTFQNKFQKVFENVMCPVGIPIFDVADGFYIFIADQYQLGKFYGCLWFVTRTGNRQKIRELKGVIPLSCGYFYLLEKNQNAVYCVYSNKSYHVPHDKEVFQCGTKNKILLKSRKNSEELYLWDLEQNTISPWSREGQVYRFPYPTSGGTITGKDGTCKIYSPDFQVSREVGHIRGISFWGQSPWVSLSYQWAIIELEEQTVLLDRTTGIELFSAPIIRYNADGYFEVGCDIGNLSQKTFGELMDYAKKRTEVAD
ncbi:MAG: hypothetical protein ACI4QJ_07085 [Candidatus Spyradenecus sp.]